MGPKIFLWRKKNKVDGKICLVSLVKMVKSNFIGIFQALCTFI